MKKYTKPEIVFEDFSLSVNISLGCKNFANLTETTCAYSDDFYTDLFDNGIASPCKTFPVDGDSVCYHNPSEEYSVYSS